MLRMPFASQHVSIGARELQGFLDYPEDPQGLVLFVHEHGCGRHNPDDNQIATTLHKLGFATLLVDLFGPKEQHELVPASREAELSTRICEVIDWTASAPALNGLALHCVGSGNIAEPLLRAVLASDRTVSRVALFAPPRDPDGRLIGQAPPMLILHRCGDIPADQRSADPAVKSITRVSLDPLGEARLEGAGRHIGEWIGCDRRTAPAQDRPPQDQAGPPAALVS